LFSPRTINLDQFRFFFLYTGIIYVNNYSHFTIYFTYYLRRAYYYMIELDEPLKLIV